VEILDRRMTGAQVIETDVAHIASACREELASLAGRRILLTGGGGFIGYYLCHTFLHANAAHALNIRVDVLDAFARGVSPWVPAVEQAARGAIRFITSDISKGVPADVEPVDYVIHAASIASPTFYRQHPIETIDANVWGLRRVFDWYLERRSAAPGKILFFSSSEIYGDADQIPTPETCRGSVSCTGPRACYDESKRFGETLAVNYAAAFDVPVTIVRPFNNYGPGLRQGDRRVLADFVADVLAGRDMTVMSDGSPTRTFCYIADAVAGYLKVLVRGRVAEPYNIGTEAPEISVNELARLMADRARDLLGYDGRVVFGPPDVSTYLTDNPRRRCPDIAKARAELQYAPSISLADGLGRTLIWNRDFPQ
jgi:nucleoside-diphosphate-sugar epimerase